MMKSFIKITISLLFSTSVIASPHNLRIAIVDNLRSQKLSSINYEQDYLAGVQSAVATAKIKGLNIEYKYFKYEKGPLDILQQIPKIKEWKPDYIIGPRFSDKFILLKPYFTDVIVVSPLASAENLKAIMPANFFSLSSDDHRTSEVITKFINTNYPNAKQIFILSVVDCKSCTEIGATTGSLLKKSGHPRNIVLRTFLSEEIENIEINKLVPDFHSGDIIVTPNISYVSSILLARITNHLQIPNIVFIGGDGWASSSVAYVGKIKTIVPFIAYHLSQWPLENSNSQLKSFRSSYYQIFGKLPSDTISFATYEATIAAVDALKINASTHKSLTSKKLIFENYEKIISKYRSNTYAIYKLNTENETIVDLIKFNNEK